MDTTFINTENGRTSEYHVLLLNLTNNVDLRSEKILVLNQILVFITHGKI